MNNNLLIDTRMRDVIYRELRKVAATDLEPYSLAVRPEVFWRTVAMLLVLIPTYVWYVDGSVLASMIGVLVAIALWVPMYMYYCFGKAIQPIEFINWDLKGVSWNSDGVTFQWSDCLDPEIETNDFIRFSDISDIQYFPEFMVIRILGNFSQERSEEGVLSHYDREGYIDLPDAFVNKGEFIAMIEQRCGKSLKVCVNKDVGEIWE